MVLDADVARLSSYMRHHIRVHGHYSFQLPDFGAAHRALRDPDGEDDDLPARPGFLPPPSTISVPT